ncbi:MAG: (Fe-S)-binding protein [Candidatus Bathyarchaeota archaeon]|jgi:Fe-S oxidoreductase|nr:(Fe-S)-binding protein [Candidatus Bathyarchaeota archaeon]|tara:strand:- start:5 stop:1117 length:1113 start_codon:yes stop_codon:yes gene_type:complete
MAEAQKFIHEFKLFKCIQCGVCTGSCPVSAKAGLNIRQLMREINLNRRVEIPPEDVLWSCTTCSACEARCPKELSPYKVILEMRGLAVEGGMVSSTVRDALESVFKHGNPWSRGRAKRSEWEESLDVPEFKKETEFLYYVGCTPAYDPRGQKTAKALVSIFSSAGVDYGTLGDKETCCGDTVYGMGEKGLFEMVVEDNTELFEERGVKSMVTTSPHCFNMFKNRYGNPSFEAQHYTQLLATLIDKGKLRFSRSFQKTVTYHDPCFLGRQNGIYEDPRKVLKAVPGLNFLELDRSRERGLCCEGGGGRILVDIPGERLAERRIRGAVEVGAEIIATACPFCLSTLEDAVLTSGLDHSVKVMDIAEIIAKVL